jgi:hypothetical protein
MVVRADHVSKPKRVLDVFLVDVVGGGLPVSWVFGRVVEPPMPYP